MANWPALGDTLTTDYIENHGRLFPPFTVGAKRTVAAAPLYRSPEVYGVRISNLSPKISGFH